jgi:hypothetical protein
MDLEVRPLGGEVQIEIAERGREGVGVAQARGPRLGAHREPVGEERGRARQDELEDARAVHASHQHRRGGDAGPRAFGDDLHVERVGPERADHQRARLFVQVRAEDVVRIGVLDGGDQLELLGRNHGSSRGSWSQGERGRPLIAQEARGVTGLVEQGRTRD